MIEVRDLRKSFEVARPARSGRGRGLSLGLGLTLGNRRSSGGGANRMVAVDGVSFDARPGEIFGVLGPNGAGKTTTLRMLATTISPDSGTATIRGYDIVRQPVEVRRTLGVLTANIGLYPRLTARENVAYFARLYGLAPADANRRIADLFRLLDMESYADRRTDTFSTGMKQKVAIARAVVHDPPVMIFDEPTSGLDVLGARTVVEFIRSCRAQGKCVVLSTHQMVEVAKLCDRVAIIHNGRIQATGTVPELLARAGAPDLEEAFLALVDGIQPRPLQEAVHA